MVEPPFVVPQKADSPVSIIDANFDMYPDLLAMNSDSNETRTTVWLGIPPRDADVAGAFKFNGFTMFVKNSTYTISSTPR